MLVALAVFAILGILSSRILVDMANLSRATGQRGAELTELQRALAVVERDLEQLANRPVRDEFGDFTDAVTIGGAALLELTRRGWQNPLGAPRAELQRVAYLWRDDKLLRLFWPMLDRAPDTEPLAQVLLEGVEEADFLAYDDVDANHHAWPLQDDEERGLAAVELRLRLAAFGRVERLFMVPPSDQFLVGETRRPPAADEGAPPRRPQ